MCLSRLGKIIDDIPQEDLDEFWNQNKQDMDILREISVFYHRHFSRFVEIQERYGIFETEAEHMSLMLFKHNLELLIEEVSAERETGRQFFGQSPLNK